MDKIAVVELLKKKTEETSQTKVAEEIGVSVQFINDVLRGYRQPSDKVLSYLGLKREIVKVK